jgi:eukaryotic-like serine/threonine-protein kinase
MGQELLDILAFRRPEDRYELRRRLWADGPHEGWEAFDRLLGREVVLHRPYPTTDLARFLARARNASALRHPNLIPVHDLNLYEDGTPFFTTPLLRANSIDTLLRRHERAEEVGEGAFPLEPMVRAVRDACRAVDHLHRWGFLLLDLCPGSVLITEDPREVFVEPEWEVIAARQAGDPRVNHIIGRPPYMSPEQATGDGAGLGPPTDVYGLGGILHYLLFGQPSNRLPGTNSPLEIVRALIGRGFEPRAPSPLRPQIEAIVGRRGAGGLIQICMKALAFEPERRYPTAAALGDALDDWLEGRRSPWWERLGRR